jgi:hypothetical protein
MTAVVLVLNLVSAGYFLFLHAMSLMGTPSHVSESLAVRWFWLWFVPFALSIVSHRLAVRDGDNGSVHLSVSWWGVFGPLPRWARVVHAATLLYCFISMLARWPFPRLSFSVSEYGDRVALITSVDLFFAMGGLAVAHSAWSATRPSS